PGAAPARAWRSQDPADRSLPYPVPDAEQLALNAPVTPARVLPRPAAPRDRGLRLETAVVPRRSGTSTFFGPGADARPAKCPRSRSGAADGPKGTAPRTPRPTRS